MTEFKLYPEEQRWWSFNDYRAVLNLMALTGAKSVLEFGPGSSTLALVEGGAKRVDSCEDDLHWAELYRSRLAKYRGVTVLRYSWQPSLSIPTLDKHYDLALVDGPLETERRPEVIRFCLDRCDWVVVPLECDGGSEFLTECVTEESLRRGRPMQVLWTGPLAGAFAVVGR